LDVKQFCKSTDWLVKRFCKSFYHQDDLQKNGLQSRFTIRRFCKKRLASVLSMSVYRKTILQIVLSGINKA